MSFIGSMFDNSKGAGFQAQAANLQNPVTAADVTAGQQQVQGGIGQQQAFLNALQGQGGIGNQSSVFNQQQNLANQLQQQAQGGGPNPAQAMLAQNTGQNVQNQAALMGSQRGAGANVGMMARQAAQQGAATQQQAVGQAATMGAQQQLAAQQALQQQQSMMGNMATQQVGQQAGALAGLNQAAQSAQQMNMGQLQSQNQLAAQQQMGINQIQGGLAGQNLQAQSGLVGGLLQSAGGAAAMLSDERQKKNIASGEDEAYKFLDSIKPKTFEYKNPDAPGARDGKQMGVMAQDLEKSSAGKSMVKEGPAGKTVDFGEGMAKMLAAQADLHERLKALEGGSKHFASGGMAQPFGASTNPMASMSMPGSGGPKSAVGQALQGLGSGLSSSGGGNNPLATGANALGTGIAQGIQKLASSGKSDEQMTPEWAMQNMAGLNQGLQQKAHGGPVNLKKGGKVHGDAKVKGDSLKNDTVPAMLSPKEIVLPRSVTMHPNAPDKAAKFVAAILAKKGMR